MIARRSMNAIATVAIAGLVATVVIAVAGFWF